MTLASSSLRLFTEGFDTLDLKEAKALLDELAAYSAFEDSFPSR